MRWCIENCKHDEKCQTATLDSVQKKKREQVGKLLHTEKLAENLL